MKKDFYHNITVLALVIKNNLTPKAYGASPRTPNCSFGFQDACGYGMGGNVIVKST